MTTTTPALLDQFCAADGNVLRLLTRGIMICPRCQQTCTDIG